MKRPINGGIVPLPPSEGEVPMHHTHYVVDIYRQGVPGVDKFIIAGVSLWTQSRDEVHEFIAEGKAKGFTLSHRILTARMDCPADECECAHSSATKPTITSSSTTPVVDPRPPCPDCGAPLDVTPTGETCTSVSCTYSI